MLKVLAWIVLIIGLILGGLYVMAMNSPSLQRNSAAYGSWPILRLAGDFLDAKGLEPRSMKELLDYSRDKGTEDAKSIEEYLKRYDPIVMVRWHNKKKRPNEDGFIGDLWIKPTQNCSPGWISVIDGNNIKPNQYPPSDAVYLRIPGSPKP